MVQGEVTLLDFWASSYCMRVKIALAEKGVTYESKEEQDLLGAKSELLVASNPVYQKVPVLIHGGKPVCESTIIVGYIDETWTSPPLLPACAYGRAQARFWADYVDKKLFDAMAGVWMGKGEEAKKNFIDTLKVLEGALEDKDFFSGTTFGFVDIMTIPFTSWFLTVEKYGGFKVDDECPKFAAWIKRCMQKETVANALPDPEKVYEFVGVLRKMYGIE